MDGVVHAEAIWPFEDGGVLWQMAMMGVDVRGPVGRDGVVSVPAVTSEMSLMESTTCGQSEFCASDEGESGAQCDCRQGHGA